MTTTNKGRFGVREVSNTDIKLSFGQKLAYGIGDCGYNLMYYWVSTYLMIFYTDTIGISAAAVAVLMLVIRIFDAVNDPIIGSMADTTKQKTGTYCRRIQWDSFALGVTAILLFTGNPNWSNTAKLIYAYVTYTLVVIASTCTNMPYGVLNGTLTSNGLERTKISTIRMFCITLGNMGVTALAVHVLNAFGMRSGHNSRAYLLTLIVFCLVAVPMLWTTAFGCKEVIMLPKQQKVAMKDRLQTLKAWPIWSLILGMTLFGMIYYGRAAVYPYYFTYYCGNAGMLTFFGVMMGIGGLIRSFIQNRTALAAQTARPATGARKEEQYESFMHDRTRDPRREKIRQAGNPGRADAGSRR